MYLCNGEVKMKIEEQIIRKLDEFIRKYYKFRMIRGTIYTMAVLAALFLFVTVLEHYFYFNKEIRAVFFFTFLTCTLLIVIRLIIIPFIQILRIGPTLSYEEAANIIGKHFSEIDDKLLNTLQLIKLKSSEIENLELLVACITQKINELKVFSFSSVIKLKNAISYFKYAVVPLTIIILITILVPGFFSQPVERIIYYSVPYHKSLPYNIEILNKHLWALQQEDFDLQIKVIGNEIPEELFLISEEIKYHLIKVKQNQFHYLFKSLQKNVHFKIETDEYTTKTYQITVLPRPIIIGIEAILHFPDYIKIEDGEIQNSGDITIPEGTEIKWNFYTRDVDAIELIRDTSDILLIQNKDTKFSYDDQFFESKEFKIFTQNKFAKRADSLYFIVTVIKDRYPTITAWEVYDSLITQLNFFQGEIKDDYGFSKLLFYYEKSNVKDSILNKQKCVEIQIDLNVRAQTFHYSTTFDELLFNAGDQIKYYFEVWDNDGINGPKFTRTVTKEIEIPSIEEIEKKTKENYENIVQDLEKNIETQNEISKGINNLSKKLIEQPNVGWQEKKNINDLVKQTIQLSERMQEIKKRNDENIKISEDFLNTSERIVTKQKELQELIEKLLNEDVKKLIEEVNALLNQTDKNKINEYINKFNEHNSDVEKALDRSLALMKQLEFERKLEDIINQLKTTAEEQNKNAENTLEKNEDLNKIIQKQETIKEQYNSIKDQLKELSENAKELQDAPDIDATQEKQKQIDELLNKIESELKSKNRKQASGNQEKTAGSMNELAMDLQNMQMESENDQLEEDMAKLRILLENLLRLSFEEEQIIYNTRNIRRNDPKYQELIGLQNTIQEKIVNIEDSLNEIGKRQFFLKPVISKEIKELKRNLSGAKENIENRKIQEACTSQQFVMTSINNLAILLEETIDRMNREMNMNMNMMSKGSSSCKTQKMRGGKMNMKGMKEMQERLTQQLSKMKDKLGSLNRQQKGIRNENEGLNEEIARMAALQEAIRNELQKYQERMIEEGQKDGGNVNKAIEEMEQIEKDIINRNIKQETLNRQQRILTRMLESEKAEEMREREEKRESEETKIQKISNPKESSTYKKHRQGENEILIMEEIQVREYYKNIIDNYMIKINK